MDLRIFTEPQQGATYGEQLRIARHAEHCGFDGFFRSDHFLRMGPGEQAPGPTDSWLTLAALARETERIRLGTLVSSATFRLPGLLAIAVAQADEMSGGRVELGLGAGWFEAEHEAYGVPFPGVAERFDRLEEQLAVIAGLWATPAGQRFSFDGSYYQLHNSPALPKPVQRPQPPLIVGGGGPRRTPALAAQYAAEFNAAFTSPEEAAQRFDRVGAACREIGRDPQSLVYSVAITVAIGSNDAEVRRRADAIGRTVAEMQTGGSLAATPQQARERLAEYAAAGASRIYLQVFDLGDLDHLDLMAAELMGA